MIKLFGDLNVCYSLWNRLTVLASISLLISCSALSFAINSDLSRARAILFSFAPASLACLVYRQGYYYCKLLLIPLKLPIHLNESRLTKKQFNNLQQYILAQIFISYFQHENLLTNYNDLWNISNLQFIPFNWNFLTFVSLTSTAWCRKCPVLEIVQRLYLNKVFMDFANGFKNQNWKTNFSASFSARHSSIRSKSHASLSFLFIFFQFFGCYSVLKLIMNALYKIRP